MDAERIDEIVLYLSQRKYRHVERFSTGRLSGPYSPEEMKELVGLGYATTKGGGTQFYITDEGRRRVRT